MNYQPYSSANIPADKLTFGDLIDAALLSSQKEMHSLSQVGATLEFKGHSNLRQLSKQYTTELAAANVLEYFEHSEITHAMLIFQKIVRVVPHALVATATGLLSNNRNFTYLEFPTVKQAEEVMQSILHSDLCRTEKTFEMPMPGGYTPIAIFMTVNDETRPANSTGLTLKTKLFGPTRQNGDTRVILLSNKNNHASPSIEYPHDLGTFDAENKAPGKRHKRKNVSGGHTTAPPPTPRKKQQYSTAKNIAQASSPKSPTPQTSQK
ncbi:hypothetical protein BCR33DRAFT_858513 [Rhizoclosmatium globosum]|uniref:Uncharacterized protein n=1 Tax=Rhizoclosmatium globosum TaxID=329046 RepID=A0A1Y2AYC1_9FUNG|nr:hypothetical protein BCR33DRAFT_858513 [Rhizoclosmatium globosum]|eukprot:ORY27290.1 hypothetical protein BCR33DRAFT_858513 [Rhizoclosmatium globosum]